MRAVVQDRYGGAEVLRLAEIGKPVPKDDEVLIRVAAAGVDRGVWHLMTGLPHLVRIAGYGLLRPRYPVPGMDLAGTIEAIGAEVSDLAVGDEVFGIAQGTFAEYVCARTTKLTTKPRNLDFEQAAAVPVSALTALQALQFESRLQAAQSVMIIGASGGVGHFAVQIAKMLGAEVTGVCGTSKVDFVRSLGADHVIDYRKEDCVSGDRTHDVVVDIAGNRSLTRLRRALAPRGTLVIVGGEEGGRRLGGVDRQLRAALWSPFLRQKLRPQFPRERREDLVALGEMIEAGRIAPFVDRVFPLDEAADAIRHLESGRVRGKIVVRI